MGTGHAAPDGQPGQLVHAGSDMAQVHQARQLAGEGLVPKGSRRAGQKASRAVGEGTRVSGTAGGICIHALLEGQWGGGDGVGWIGKAH